jgi:uncharacterized protein YoxC
MDWAQILVIILSVFLAVFLLLAILLVAMLIKVTKQIRSMTGSAERTAQTIERAVTGFSKVTSPLMLLRLATKYLKKAKK